MPMEKKSFWPRWVNAVIAVLLIFAAGLAVVFAPIKVNVRQVPFEMMRHSYQSVEPYRSFLAKTEAFPGSPVWGDIVIEEAEYIPGGSTLIISAPYMLSSVCDVENAGSSDWKFQLGMLSQTWKNGELIRENKTRFQDTIFTIDAQDNTALLVTGNQVSVDRIDADDLKKSHLEPSGGYLVSYSASTFDPSHSRDESSTVSVRWDGMLITSGAPFVSHVVKFNLSDKIGYHSNV